MNEDILNHSTSHVMASAIRHLWPDARFAIGPSIKNGFYYDFVGDTKRAFIDAGTKLYNDAILFINNQTDIALTNLQTQQAEKKKKLQEIFFFRTKRKSVLN